MHSNGISIMYDLDASYVFINSVILSWSMCKLLVCDHQSFIVANVAGDDDDFYV